MGQQCGRGPSAVLPGAGRSGQPRLPVIMEEVSNDTTGGLSELSVIDQV